MEFKNDPIADRTSYVMSQLKAKVEHQSGIQIIGASYNRIFEMIYSYEKRLQKYEPTDFEPSIVPGRLIIQDFEPIMLKNTLQEASDIIEVFDKKSGGVKLRAKRTNYTPPKKKRK